MAQSMTAYGRAHVKTPQGLLLIEIHSVNRKSLDINANFPRELLSLDVQLRKRLAETVKRGSINVRITKEKGKETFLELPPLESLKKMHKEWSKYAESMGYDPKAAISFSTIMEFALAPGMSQEIDEAFKKEVLKGFDEAIFNFMKMKEKEGKALISDISPRLEEITAYIEKIKPLTKEAPKRQFEKLAKKLAELKISHEGDEDRLARELVIFSDKLDVTEELIRLSSHIKQFQEILGEKKNQVGKELDFLTQEMNREVNTIAAKSQELEVTRLILAIKSELEKVREQLQNIE